MRFLFEQVNVVSRGRQRPSSSRPEISLETRETRGIDPVGFATRTEYAVGLIVQATFWANKAQYENAKVAAIRNIAHHLYGDSLAKVDAARHALFNDDIEGALVALDELRSDLIS